MREWNLGSGDPLALTLAADFRFCTPDYTNDHIWELELGGGDPPALSLRTTYGLRVRSMRIFPRFHLNGQMLSDPSAFANPPSLLRFAPNFMLLSYSPFPGLDVSAEYWILDSHTAAGRLTVSNHTTEPLSTLLELCAQLSPLEGQPLSVLSLQSANVLAGQTADLAPVLFLTAGPVPGPGPYPSLALDLALAAGGSRTLTWVQAALGSIEKSFEHARHVAARAWEAERARLELVNSAQTVEVYTGDPEWDAAFALTQKTAFSLFFTPGDHLLQPSFVLARQPDQGYSPRGDGSDYGHLWNGQPALESTYLCACLPGAPELMPSLLNNYFTTSSVDGHIDWKPGLAGQRGRWLSAPLLASLAWDAARHSADAESIRPVFSRLEAFLHQWLDSAHDRDGDGFPEWDTLLQSGLEDHPLFSVWQGGQGGEISCTESPALAAMLCHDLHALARLAADLSMPDNAAELLTLANRLRGLVEDCWDFSVACYRLRDRDSHLSPPGKMVASRNGSGSLVIRPQFEPAARLLVQVQYSGDSVRRPEVRLTGLLNGERQSEHLEGMDFQSSSGRAAATTRKLFSSLATVQVTGLEKTDLVSLRVMDFSAPDISLFLPLWAEIPSINRARALIGKTLLDPQGFQRPYGIPCSPDRDPQTASLSQAIHLPWNSLIGEGLLAYDFRQEAAQLTTRLMAAVVDNLKKQHAFYRAYHAETGAGLGERNSVHGLAPLGLFLQTLGVTILSPRRVILSGKNPFPWPVTVKYRGLAVTRQAKKTSVVFPDGQVVNVNDPTESVVTAEGQAHFMEHAPIRFLMTAIVQEQDVDLAERALGALNLPVIHLASSGGFLGRRNATLLVGLPETAGHAAITALMKSCRQRVEYLAIPLEGAPLPLPTPVPVTVGGAVVFTIPVERFEEF